MPFLWADSHTVLVAIAERLERLRRLESDRFTLPSAAAVQETMQKAGLDDNR